MTKCWILDRLSPYKSEILNKLNLKSQGVQEDGGVWSTYTTLQWR